MTDLSKELKALANDFNGDIYTEKDILLMYATDASAYREIPLAVTRPKDINDIKNLIHFARKNRTSIIPRTAGTSLAGQVVGNGIIADVSKYMTGIIEINEEEKWVRVQPGVVLDELNKILASKGLFFGPETSTSNRCMIAGMVGNNSCGSHSLIYGSTRDHLLAVKCILSDGSEVEFKSLTKDEFKEKCSGNNLENKIYKQINEILNNPINQESIRKEFPNPQIKRRNTGYAIDLLLETEPFTGGGEKFNFSKLIAGSEGTLAFITEIKLNLVSVPPKHKALVCIHMNSLEDAFKANLIALKHNPSAVELMDDSILQLTKDNIEQARNRFFIKDNPAALLIVEFYGNSKEDLDAKAKDLEKDMLKNNYGYYFPVIYGDDIKKVWNLRKAGLGVLSNMPGDAKPVPVIEDTAVHPSVLPDYMKEFKSLLERYNLNCVYYAHIGTGELHLRPILNLKDPRDVELFHTIAYETAILVKKYNGSLSGEHGDGRLRGEFIPLMLGENNFNIIKEIKKLWDPENIFNPGKIVNTPKMNTFLRYKPGQQDKHIDTVFDFTKTKGILRAAEKCNGSGDCRKSEIIGGTMCPSYMATRDEFNTTRARANILREFLTNSNKSNPFDHSEIYKVMDLCLSCKACKSECPSGVDVAKLKAEFLQHYYDSNGIPFRTRLIANIASINKVGKIFRPITNLFLSDKFTGKLIKRIIGFAPERKIPPIQKGNLKKYIDSINFNSGSSGRVYLFQDEFTKYNDTDIGIMVIKLLVKLGYQVVIPKHSLSGRSFFSKGLLRNAKKHAEKNVKLLRDIVNEKNPLVGIEPSAILSFRDEYPEIVNESLIQDSLNIAKNTYTLDEFLSKEIDNGKIKKEFFTNEHKEILLHGHCQQKSIASTESLIKVLSLPVNYKVKEIKSGCCGMAGSFGFEKEHYSLSMKIGELVLFPEIRKSSTETIIVASGTSCRHQIKEGTGRNAKHPAEVLLNALKI